MNHVAFHGQLYKWVIVAVLHLREMLYMHGQSLVQEPITSRKYFFFSFFLVYYILTIHLKFYP